MHPDPSMTRKEEEEFFLGYRSRKERRAFIERRKATMKPRELEQFLLMYGSRKERKAVTQRRKAREQGQIQDEYG